MNVVIALFLLFYLILCRMHLSWAVLLMVVMLPSYLIRFSVFGIPFTLLEGMILLSFFSWLIADRSELKTNITNVFSRSKNKVKVRYPFDFEIILLLIISLISVGVAGFTNGAFGIWKAYFFEPILFFLLILNMLKIQKIKIDHIFYSLGFSALIVSMFSIYQKITGNFIFNELWSAEASRRVTSFFPYPNAVGLYLGPIVLLLIGLLFKKVRNYKLKIKNLKLEIISLAIVIILSLISIYFAKSEGALVGIAAGLFIFGLLANKKLRFITILGTIVLGAGIYFYVPARQAVYEKIILMDHSGQIRRAQWQETWEMLTDDRIIQGAGLDSYQTAVAPYHQEGIFIKDIFDPDFQRKVLFNEEFHKKAWQPLEIYLYPHNIFLNFWSELGLAGMLLFVWLLIKYFYMGFRNYNLELRNFNKSNNQYIVLGLVCAMIAIVVHGLVDVPYFKNDLSTLFWLLFALIGIIRIESKLEKKRLYKK